MTDDPRDDVDELLRDLDLALSVQPSPAVAARVRTRVDQTAPSTARLRWVLVTGTIATLVGGSYSVWHRGTPPPAASRLASVTPGRPPAGPDLPKAISSPRASFVATNDAALPAMREPAVTSSSPFAEVMVSPNVLLGLEQLQESVNAGRVSAELLAAPGLGFELAVITPTIVEIQPVKFGTDPVDQAQPGSDGGGKPDSPGETGSMPFASPLSRTRSTL